MHPQLQEIRDDFERASRRLDALAARVPPGAWFTRPGPGRWSPGECVAHLNLTSTRFLPVVREALGRTPRLPSGDAARRLRRDPLGWFLWRIMPPPVRGMRVKAKPDFTPPPDGDPDALLAEFARLQADQLDCLAAADGLALDRTMIVSPIDSRARYNLFACFGILPRHQHRHLWQAERASAQ
jgi:hypothetical protein